MQAKRRVKKVNGPQREKPLVKGSGDSGSEVGAVAVCGECLLHATAMVCHRRKELEEGVEVIAGEIREKSWELRWVISQGLVALGHVVDDHINDIDGVATTWASKVYNHKGDFGRAQLHPV